MNQMIKRFVKMKKYRVLLAGILTVFFSVREEQDVEEDRKDREQQKDRD